VVRAGKIAGGGTEIGTRSLVFDWADPPCLPSPPYKNVNRQPRRIFLRQTRSWFVAPFFPSVSPSTWRLTTRGNEGKYAKLSMKQQHNELPEAGG